MVVVSPDGCFRADGSVGVKEVRQPTKTLLIAEFPTTRAVPWMAPEDADEDMFLAIGPDASPDHRGGAANLAMADGRVISLFPTDSMRCDRDCRQSLIRTDDRKRDPVE